MFIIKSVFWIFLSGSTHAVTLSPVSIVNSDQYLEAYQNAKADEDLWALKAVTEIIYDSMIERPWGAMYFPEAQKRWRHLRSRLCPQVKEFCQELPEDFTSLDGLVDIPQGLRSEAVLQALRKHYAGRGQYLEAVAFPESVNDLFSLSVASMETRSEDLSPEIHGLKAAKVTHVQRERVFVSNVKEYSGGNTDYLAFRYDNPETVIYNMDAVKLQALRFADTWSHELRMTAKAAEQESPLLYFERNLFRRLQNRYGQEIVTYRQRLSDQLSQLPVDAVVQKALERFQKPNLVPNEVYQYISLDLFMKALTIQGTYMSLVHQNNVRKNPVFDGFESLLAIQAKTDPNLLFFLLIQELNEAETTILGQFTPGPAAAGFLIEELKAMLDLDKYEGNENFSRFRYAFEASDLFYEGLKEDAPDLYREISLSDGSLPKNFSDWSDAHFKSVLHKYLAPVNGRWPRIPLIRSLMAVALKINVEDGQHLAHVIRSSQTDKGL